MLRMKTLVAGLVAVGAGASGCAHSPDRASAIEVRNTETMAVSLASTDREPTLLSLGAGDNLGWNIYFFDVYLAAAERMGPPEQPLPMFELLTMGELDPSAPISLAGAAE